MLLSLIEIDSALFPAETFQEWQRMAFRTWGEQSSIFGPRLRERVAAIMKTAVIANGVFDKRSDTHSLRAGGATALYTQGPPLDVIHL